MISSRSLSTLWYRRGASKGGKSRASNRVQTTTDGHKPIWKRLKAHLVQTLIMRCSSKSMALTEKTNHDIARRNALAQSSSNHRHKRHISTSYVERSNLTLRMMNRRFTRLTNAFSKKIGNHVHAIALYVLQHNFNASDGFSLVRHSRLRNRHWYVCLFFSSKVGISTASSLDPADPFATPFVIKNDSPLSIKTVRYYCALYRLNFRGAIFERYAKEDALFTNRTLATPKIKANEAATIICDFGDAFRSRGRMDDGDITVVVSYRPAFVFWRGEH